MLEGPILQLPTYMYTTVKDLFHLVAGTCQLQETLFFGLAVEQDGAFFCGCITSSHLPSYMFPPSSPQPRCRLFHLALRHPIALPPFLVTAQASWSLWAWTASFGTTSPK
jgi:hypothetical protein